MIEREKLEGEKIEREKLEREKLEGDRLEGGRREGGRLVGTRPEGERRSPGDPRSALYEHSLAELRSTFEANLRSLSAGTHAVQARAAAVDELVRSFWKDLTIAQSGVALLAIGGYGRSELFPYSDIDLLLLHEPDFPERTLKEPVRHFNQQLWDSGLRVALTSRTLAECERFDADNVEFTLSLMDARPLAGDAALTDRLLSRSLPRLLTRDRKKIVARLLELVKRRHHRYGDTLFHLEPNTKDCPGGLRDTHVCAWLGRLSSAAPAPTVEFREARAFLLLVRTFLHLRHGRDDNTLDWYAQDEAAALPLGLTRPATALPIDAAFWMRIYFRHARVIDRATCQAREAAAPPRPPSRLPGMASLRHLRDGPARPGFTLESNRILLNPQEPGHPDPATLPDVMLSLFAAAAETGARLAPATEQRLEKALPILADHLEEGPRLWLHLRPILTGAHAGMALRAMHALGLLEVVLPEFHGIDTLVIRDAYHRYTVDEHTFVLIDTLHGLSAKPARPPAPLDPWRARFAFLLADLAHPGLLLLGALLHDTGKGYAALDEVPDHASASTRLAQSVVTRLELDPYESGLVLGLIRNHLEMSAALRRDVFDSETIRSFAARVPTPEALRMLTVFTYADISAVHPDALTPWKAENLHHLYAATAAYLDRNLEEERQDNATLAARDQTMHRLRSLMPNRAAELESFLDGLPSRYILTRGPEQIRLHVDLAGKPDPIDFRYAPAISELTLVSHDRPMLFADMAGALAAWGMNIVTADAFSNTHGLVVDSFRFTDTFRTLELNESERTRFTASLADVLAGRSTAESLLASRRRVRRKAPKVTVSTRIDFDDRASTHSTLLQVVAQDTPGLLRLLAQALAVQSCNIEVALIDTEGEMAIDVFYITCAGQRLDGEQQERLRKALAEAIESNAR